ncbi:MAG TPA: DUF2961 domain-containing protein [Armatimonadota bacterium]|jgi:hypothetical protein
MNGIIHPRAWRGLLMLLTLLAGCLVGQAGDVVTFASFIRQLTDLDRMPVIEEGVTCKQFSSYDRASKIDEQGNLSNWGANGDHGQYLRVEPNGEAVMAEMTGPGCIVQLWSANPRGKIRFYFDGATTPIEFDFSQLTRGLLPPFLPPIAGLGGSGCNSFVPMPYAKSCKVTADAKHDQYFHVDYVTFPATTQVETFHLPLNEEEMRALTEVSEAWKRAGDDPKPARPKTQTVKQEIVIPAGKSAVLAEMQGPAVVTAVKIKLTSPERFALRRVLLRAFWDGAISPSIEAPLGDFFGTGFAENQYKSLPLGLTSDGGYCYWPMPFRKTGRFEVVNEGQQDATLSYEIAYAPAKFPANGSYFHAKWRRDAPNTTFDWPFLECTGRGRFVGVEMNVQDPDAGWFGEGDEKVWVDGEAFPSWFGTGTEDYFCDAWGFHPFTRPLHGCTMLNTPGRTSIYRWHVMDSIPFQNKFKITIENYGKNKDYSCTAYWYQVEQASDFFTSVPVAGRLPGPTRQSGVEAESLTVAGDVQTEVISDETFPQEFSGGKALKLTPTAPTSTVALTVPVPADDVYQIELVGVQSASAVEVLLGDQSLNTTSKSFETSGKWIVGRVRLSRPSATITLKLTDAAHTPLLLDVVNLVPSPKDRNVIDAEMLPVTASPGAATHLEDGRLEWSGWSQRVFDGTKEGDWVELTLPAKIKGTYQLTLRATRGPGYGIVQASFAGQPLGQPVDGYADRFRMGVDTPLGPIDLPGGEGNTVRLTLTGKADKSTGYQFGVDAFRLSAIVLRNAIEAEGMKVLAQEKAPCGVQVLDHYGPGWSGGAQLFVTGGQGQAITLELPVAATGRYQLDIYFTKAIDYGIVDVSLDGKTIGQPFDAYNPGVIPSGKVRYGEVELTAGAHQITFSAHAKNPGATNYLMGIDALTLTPVTTP